MRTADVVCALILLGVGVVVVAEGLRLGTGWGSDGPQPGFFVFYLGVALMLSTAIVLVQAWRRAPGSGGAFVTRARLKPVATVLLPAFVAVLLTQVVGLYVSGALYLAGYMRGVGRHSWPLIVVLALGIPAATFLIFEVWFLVPLPKGPLESALGY
jgi:hypothetical protein